MGRVADASSLVAAAASAYAAFKIGRIGARLAFNVRADRVLERVSEHAQWIESCLSAGAYDTNRLLSRIVQCKAEIESIKNGVSGDALIAVRQLKTLYGSYLDTVRTGADQQDIDELLWGMFNAIATFHIHATSILGNRRMGVSDASI